MYDGEKKMCCLTFAAKLLCDIFQVSGAVKNFFVFYENIFSCIDIWLKNIQISSSPVCCFPVDIPAAGQYNYIHQITS
jgi:hypothetical protein